MLSKRYKQTEVDRTTWLLVSSGTPLSTSSDTHQVFDIRKETYIDRWSRDLGNLLLASNGDNWIPQNCWCLEGCFSVISTFLELAMMKIQLIFTELLTTCTLSIHKRVKRKRSDSVLWQKPLSLTEKSKKQRDIITKRHQNFDYITIADRLRTVSWSNSSHSTGVIKPVYECSTFLLTATAVQSKGHTFKNLTLCRLRTNSQPKRRGHENVVHNHI